MPGGYMRTVLTPDVRAAQERTYGRHQTVGDGTQLDPLTADEVDFLARRDSFYLASTNSDGWPYVQHRGGPPGFLKVLGPHRLGFADFKGNRQLITTGNLAGDDRVALFLMDYPRRERLKILGHGRFVDAREDAGLTERVSPSPELRGKIERVCLIETTSFDWNCPQYITPRYTAAEIAEVVAPLKARIAELEAALELR